MPYVVLSTVAFFSLAATTPVPMTQAPLCLPALASMWSTRMLTEPPLIHPQQGGGAGGFADLVKSVKNAPASNEEETRQETLTDGKCKTVVRSNNPFYRWTGRSRRSTLILATQSSATDTEALKAEVLRVNSIALKAIAERDWQTYTSVARPLRPFLSSTVFCPPRSLIASFHLQPTLLGLADML